jgi:methanogenic corrinoid protein MtbC1
VIAPVLVEIGHQWAGGRLSIADEHLATGIAYDVMRLVSRTATSHPRRSRERVLLAAVGSEDHVVGLRMLGDLAEARGFDVRYLGAAVPVDTLADIVGKHQPEIVGLSVTMAASAVRLNDALDHIAASGHAAAGILVGGRGVRPALAQRPNVHHASDARAGIEVIERIAAPVD